MSDLEKKLRQEMGDENFEECYRSCFGRLRADRYGDFPLHEVTLRMVLDIYNMEVHGSEPHFMPFGAPGVRTPEPDSLRIIQGSGRQSSSSGGGGSSSSSGGCYIATAVYGSYDCPQVWTLRRYRDNDLAATWFGRLFIRTYYAISPKIVTIFGESKWIKHLWKYHLDRFTGRLKSKGVSDEPYDDWLW